jgi:hypothetical protein
VPKTAVVENEFITLWYEPETKIVSHEFHQPASGNVFRTAMLAGVEQLRNNGAYKWLSNDKRNAALNEEDLAWVLATWQQAAIAAGWKYWAIILPGSAFGQDSLQQLIAAFESKGVVTRAFSDISMAKRWLTAQD